MPARERRFVAGDKLEKLTRLSRPVVAVSEESRNAARRLAAIESSET